MYISPYRCITYITAAHCLVGVEGVDFKADNLRVGLGKVLRSYNWEENDSITITVSICCPVLDTFRKNHFAGELV